MKRQRRTFADKASVAPSLAFRPFLFKAACLWSGMHPQLCTVFLPIRAAVVVCVAKNWKCTPSTQPRPSKKRDRSRRIHVLVPEPGMPKRPASRGVDVIVFRARGACVLFPRTDAYASSSWRSSFSSVWHLSSTHCRNANCSFVGDLSDFSSVRHHSLILDVFHVW